ncbi:MAG TPA: TetR/AcrR family transcriptional regulator [Reyranella sp.]|jgi:TetR/AcrR family transcriptional regulator, transcriptional repressor for nem operon|nr:TetR/AcrR family transcriptional regulator [Reyranella sp.]
MPWSPNHKEESRRRIIDAAAAAFRARGIAGISIADIMRQVGLTHGGFYAHFKSKEDLIAETLAELQKARMARFEDMAARAPDEALLGAADFYLSSRHREHPETGCSIATLGSELARTQGAARRQISTNIEAWLDRFAEAAPGKDPAERRRQARGAFAAMIGGLILARAIEDPHESDEVLADVRTFLDEALDEKR